MSWYQEVGKKMSDAELGEKMRQSDARSFRAWAAQRVAFGYCADDEAFGSFWRACEEASLAASWRNVDAVRYGANERVQS